jgi:hypothetical protein
MKIAAEQIDSKLKVFIEGSNWTVTTQPFNKEIVKFGLLVYYMEGQPIFHDAVSREEPDTNPSLMFCRESLTLSAFKKKIKKTGHGEPYEVRLGNDKFDLQKEFPRAYTLTFHNYRDNNVFAGWLESLPALEAGFVSQRLKDNQFYFSRELSEFREFNSFEDFVCHRFKIWHEKTVKVFGRQ